VAVARDDYVRPAERRGHGDRDAVRPVGKVDAAQHETHKGRVAVQRERELHLGRRHPLEATEEVGIVRHRVLPCGSRSTLPERRPVNHAW
jgi:hypothetical protein